MSSIVVAGDTSGSVTLSAPAVAGSTVLTLPAVSGTLLASGGASSFTSVTTPIINSATTLQLQTNGTTTAVTIDASQNVGIGTSTSSAKLTIGGLTLGTTSGSQSFYQVLSSFDSNVDILEISNTRQIAGTSWNGAGTRLQERIDVTYMGYIQFNGGSGTTNDGGISFGTGLTSTAVSVAERMRIDSTGNVFVGGTTQNTATAPVYSSTTAKAWVNFNGGFGNTAGIINASFNVSSITVGGTGSYTVNFTNAMVDVKYSAVGSCVYNDTTSMLALTFFTQATTSISVKTNYQNATLNATTTNSIAVFR